MGSFVAGAEMDTPHAKLMEVVSRNIPLPKDYKTPKPARKPPTASIKWTPDEDQRLREVSAHHGGLARPFAVVNDLMIPVCTTYSYGRLSKYMGPKTGVRWLSYLAR